MLVLLANKGLEVAILDVGDGEGLEDTGVGVTEVGVLHLEGVAQGLNLVGHVGSSVESTEDVV